MGTMHDDDEGTYYEDDQPVEDVLAIISRPPDGYTTGDNEPHAAGQTTYLAPQGLEPLELLPHFDSRPLGEQVAS